MWAHQNLALLAKLPVNPSPGDRVDAAVEGLAEVTVASPWCRRRGNRGTEKQAINDPSGPWI